MIMQNITETEFLSGLGQVSEKLAEAVIAQFGDWGSFTEQAEDVVNHGIDGGFGGFTYYSDTVAFAKENLDSIKELIAEQADGFGISGPIEFIKGFNSLNDNYTIDDIGKIYYGQDENHVDYRHIMNALAWYAAEEVCRAYVDALENC